LRAVEIVSREELSGHSVKLTRKRDVPRTGRQEKGLQRRVREIPVGLIISGPNLYNTQTKRDKKRACIAAACLALLRRLWHLAHKTQTLQTSLSICTGTCEGDLRR